MFKNIFSFSGRIRRTEYWLTAMLIELVLVPIIFLLGIGTGVGFILLIIPFWIAIAAGVKRSHDMGNSGWLILIPIYNPFILAFGGSQPFTNEYGDNPKGLNMGNTNPPPQPNIVIHNVVGDNTNSSSVLHTQQPKPENPSPQNADEPDLLDKVENIGNDFMHSINKNLGNNQSNTELTNANTEHNNKIAQLKQLKELLDQGILTQEEFDQQKKEIL